MRYNIGIVTPLIVRQLVWQAYVPGQQFLGDSKMSAKVLTKDTVWYRWPEMWRLPLCGSGSFCSLCRLFS